MDENTWLTCRVPQILLQSKLAGLSQRRLRLFACACCRRIWHLMRDKRSRAAVVAAEAVCESRRSSKVRAMLDAGQHALCVVRAYGREISAHSSAADAAWHATVADDCRSAEASSADASWAEARSTHPEQVDVGVFKANREQVRLLHEIVGNPWRPLHFDPSWKTPTVAALAEAAYEMRLLPSGVLDPVRLAILADALEEVGAANELLEHLRAPGPHVRGCHVLDRIRQVAK